GFAVLKKIKIYYKENRRIIEAIIQTLAINRNFTRNFHLIVLWWKACIPSTAPTHHHSPVYRSRFFSDILCFWAVALYLSIHRAIKVNMLMRRKYQIYIEVRVIFINSEFKIQNLEFKQSEIPINHNRTYECCNVLIFLFNTRLLLRLGGLQWQ
ncbi:MAG: hypothetical protein ACD_80C00079G0001, partial [uncultured bacterium (gcode 4)]